MPTGPQTSPQRIIAEPDWHQSLASAIRDPDILIDLLGLPENLRAPARRAARLFDLMVPHSFLARMRSGDAADPLLRQVLPLEAEFRDVWGFSTDAVGDDAARRAPGLLHKYAGRALLIATGSCAVHCRYCFRRHYPYGQEPRRLADWEPALQAIAEDHSLQEIILSGGDPLMLTDRRLGELIGRLGQIPHLRRLRIHSRLPIVLPERVTDSLLGLLMSQRALTPIMVVHANHPAEVAGECAEGLSHLVRSGVTTLNQAVLLRGVNDSVEALTELSQRLVNLGVMPYYLHQLDRVQGSAHFEVDDAVATELVRQLRTRLPGYAVPQLVREVRGELSKLPLV
jgi:EF-P beta-lysylation protein EpmB